MPNVQRRFRIQRRTVDDIARYSASQLERDTQSCFCVFQEMDEPPSVINHPVRERRVLRQPDQSESHQTDNWRSV